MHDHAGLAVRARTPRDRQRRCVIGVSRAESGPAGAVLSDGGEQRQETSGGRRGGAEMRRRASESDHRGYHGPSVEGSAVPVRVSFGAVLQCRTRRSSTGAAGSVVFGGGAVEPGGEVLCGHEESAVDLAEPWAEPARAELAECLRCASCMFGGFLDREQLRNHSAVVRHGDAEWPPETPGVKVVRNHDNSNGNGQP